MAYWNGTAWAPEPVAAAPETRTPTLSRRIKPAAFIAVLAVVVATGSVFAGRGGASAGPTLTASFGSDGARLDGSSALRVAGTNYTPSSGGQQVFLWVGYPNDYCDADFDPCHGFYFNPWVNDDGTFSASFDNVAMQSGTGTVKATQWNPKNHKWVQVATTSYSVP